MTLPRITRTFALVLNILLVASAAPIFAQEKPKQVADPEKERINEIAKRAYDEVREAQPERVPTPNAQQTASKWAALLWEYHESHSSTPAAAQAAYHAINVLRNAGLNSEMKTRADLLGKDDSAWLRVIELLFWSSDKAGDFGWFISKMRTLANESTNRELRARADLFLGQALWKTDEAEKARAAFEAVRTEWPESNLSRQAGQFLFDISQLNIGQKVPEFSVAATDGQNASPAQYSDKALLIVFWASW